MNRGRSLRLFVLAVAASLLTGCGYDSLQQVPLPGGAALGDEPYEVTVMLRDAVDLVPNNSVRVNDVPVGVVRSLVVAPDGWTAQAEVEVNGAITLPANAVARLRQTSLLGEKFVELAPPPQEPPTGRLSDGAVIGLDRTDVGAQVEEVLGALSLLLNGGGVEKFQTIAREVSDISTGNEPELRALIGNLNVFVGTLDRQRQDIVRAIDSLDRLTRTLVDQRARLANVIDNLAPGLDVLNAQRGNLVEMLQALQRLGDVGTDVINRSQANTVADLQALQPILGKLVESGSDFPGSLQILVTIPFNDKSLVALKGDYANITVTLDLNLQDLLNNLVTGASLPDVNAIFEQLTPQPLNGLTLPENLLPGANALGSVLTPGLRVPDGITLPGAPTSGAQQPGTADGSPSAGTSGATPQGGAPSGGSAPSGGGTPSGGSGADSGGSAPSSPSSQPLVPSLLGGS